MPKKKKVTGKRKKASASKSKKHERGKITSKLVADTTFDDPFLLYKNYVKQCEMVGIATHDSVKATLCDAENNPNNGKQILIGGGGNSNGDNGIPPPALGSGGCRALVMAILGGRYRGGLITDTSRNVASPSGSSQQVSQSVYTALKEIRIWKSNLGDGGVDAISKLLRYGGPEMQLSFLEIPDNCIGVFGAQALGRALCCGMNSSLLTLNLDFNSNLGSVGITALCRGLCTNSTLKRLFLRYCGIEKEGGQPLNEMLSFPKLALCTLELAGNHLGGVGLSAMCSGIGLNKRLEVIGLADNSIASSESDTAALEAFAEVLSNHATLQEVDLINNPIGQGGGMALLKGLHENKTINSFKVDTTLPTNIYSALYRTSNEKGAKKKSKKKGKKP